MQETITGNIQGAKVSVSLGDITTADVDALLVPEFSSGGTHGGVRLAVIRRYGEKGFDSFDEFCHKKGNSEGKLEFGEVVLTTSGGGGLAKHFLHATTVGSGRENEFRIVKEAMSNALKIAADNGIETIASPALGTGIIGALTNKQSAEAMMSAIREHVASGGKPIGVEFVIYGDKGAFDSFVSVMRSEVPTQSAYADQSGARPFDTMKWVAGMERAGSDQGKIFGDKPDEVTKTFPLSSLISVYHKVYLTDTLVPVYELLEHLFGQRIFEGDLEAASEYAKPLLGEQFPNIAKIDATRLPSLAQRGALKNQTRREQIVKVWLNNQENAYGTDVTLTAFTDEDLEDWPLFRQMYSAVTGNQDNEPDASEATKDKALNLLAGQENSFTPK